MKKFIPKIGLASVVILFSIQITTAQIGGYMNKEYVELEKRFVADYLQLSPQERVNLWLFPSKGQTKLWLKKHGYFDDFGFLHSEAENQMVIRGLDAVPYLTEIVRRRKGRVRRLALNLLCKMDRFVPTERLPKGIPAQPLFASNEPVGLLDNFMIVDGRRIGKEGIEIVLWAAEQTDHEDLRFHAREYTGLMEQDLRKLSFDEQVELWRKSSAKCNGYPGMNDDCRLREFLDRIFRENADKILPLLIEMTEHDENPYIREDAIDLIWSIDGTSMRLRGTEIGLKAIETVRKAFLQCNHQPRYHKRERCDDNWGYFSKGIFDDENSIALGWIITFENLYGIGIQKKNAQAISDEGKKFITYLTKIDPYFMNWEFINPTLEYFMHPRFKAKWERYYEHWKRFKASQSTNAPKNTNLDILSNR